ncbi:BglG family transcription antiterminator [Hungatella effluvii]|uniref:BglG family transcription antiterminator n=1 Tax=Hungatella effluvii TaxID=1096246 RepID=UPI0022E6283F|nr:BglG family transcription antiterminator [Hungatella effluvii]
MEKRGRQLLAALQGASCLTADQLAAHLNVSNRTVRTAIKNLSQLLPANGARIEVRRGSGYCLRIDETSCFETFCRSIQEQQQEQFLPNSSEERIRYVLDYLLNASEYVKTEDLSEMLYISRRTLADDMKTVEKLLAEYNLTLKKKPGYGIKVEGDEMHLRLCIATYAAGYRNPCEETDILTQIAEIVRASLQESNLYVSEPAFQNLVVHIFIAIKRVEDGHYIPLSVDMIQMAELQKEMKAAKMLVEALERRFSFRFPEAEQYYIAIHLAGKQFMEVRESDTGNLVISHEISCLVTDMLQAVYEAFHFDFRNDLELRMSLCQHIVPLAIRLQYGLKLKNPLLREIKERYALAYMMALQACSIIATYCQKQLSEDESGYFALAFALALERKKSRIAKKNVLLVCASGKGSAQLMLYRYQEEFGSYINHIEACDVNHIAQKDLTQFDYIFTTVPIPIRVPVPIQEVEYFLEEQDIKVVKKVLTNRSAGSVRRYYCPEFFLTGLDFKTKEEILSYMCQHIEKRQEMPPGFFESVMKREHLSSTDFGNLAAMPHPFEALSETTFVCVGILKEPVLWGTREVQIVFLTAIENKENRDLQRFYQVTSKLLLNSGYIHELLQKQEFSVLEEILAGIELEIDNRRE